MDACDFVTGVNLKLRSFKSIAKAFRVLEFFFLLLLLCWIFTRLPFVVRISGEYFRQLVGVVLSPVFVFILCNFIVLTLFWKYRRYSGNDGVFHNVAGAEVVYNSFVENAEFLADFFSGNSSLETVYEDKQMIFEEPETLTNKALMILEVPRRTQSEKMNKEKAEEISVKLWRSETEKCRKITNYDGVSPETDKFREITNFGGLMTEMDQYWKITNPSDLSTETEKCRKVTKSGDTEFEKCWKVTNSGNIWPDKCQKVTNSRDTSPNKCWKVTNPGDTEAEQCRKVTSSGDISPSPAYEVDELSNEEFQKTIENFIAKQTKFHQQEKLAIVLHSQA
ncbi:unnamed protein product [Withania somnifera]